MNRHGAIDWRFKLPLLGAVLLCLCAIQRGLLLASRFSFFSSYCFIESLSVDDFDLLVSPTFQRFRDHHARQKHKRLAAARLILRYRRDRRRRRRFRAT